MLAALTVDPAKRPSAEQLLAHPWLAQAAAVAAPALQPPAAPAAGRGGERRSSGDFTIAALSLGGGGEGSPAAAPPEAADQPEPETAQQEPSLPAEPPAEEQREEAPASGGMTKAASVPNLEALGAQQAEETSPPPSPSPSRQQFQRKASRLGPSTAGPAPPASPPGGGWEGAQAQGGSAAELTRVKAYMTRQGGPLMSKFRVTPASPRGSSAGVAAPPDAQSPSPAAAI